MQSEARSGSLGHEPITMPRHSRPRRSIASTVSAVWLSVPRPARATTISGASSSSRDVGDRALLAEAAPAARRRPRSTTRVASSPSTKSRDLARRDARHAGAGGGALGRQRLGIVGERVDGRAGALAHGPRIVVVAGLRGLHVGGVLVAERRARRTSCRRRCRSRSRRCACHHRLRDPREVLVGRDVRRHRVDQVAERAQPHAVLDRDRGRLGDVDGVRRARSRRSRPSPGGRVRPQAG